jgi:hypothetical protein
LAGKIFSITVALFALGIIVLPNTVTLFVGQHYWYNLTETGNNVPCEKCHADVHSELSLSGIHLRMSCEGCHRTDNAVKYAVDWSGDVEPGRGAHAASTVECMLCHDGRTIASGTNFTHYYLSASSCSQCHNPPSNIAGAAGGFNLTVDSDDTGELAAHLKFVNEAIEDSLMEGANEACIACHTAAAVKLNWTHARTYEFNVVLEDPYINDYGLHSWTFSDTAYNGSANVITWGNTTGSGSTTYTSDWPGNIDGIYS